MADKLLKTLDFGTGDVYHPAPEWKNVQNRPCLSLDLDTAVKNKQMVASIANTALLCEIPNVEFAQNESELYVFQVYFPEDTYGIFSIPCDAVVTDLTLNCEGSTSNYIELKGMAADKRTGDLFGTGGTATAFMSDYSTGSGVSIIQGEFDMTSGLISNDGVTFLCMCFSFSELFTKISGTIKVSFAETVDLPSPLVFSTGTGLGISYGKLLFDSKKYGTYDCTLNGDYYEITCDAFPNFSTNQYPFEGRQIGFITKDGSYETDICTETLSQGGNSSERYYVQDGITVISLNQTAGDGTCLVKLHKDVFDPSNYGFLFYQIATDVITMPIFQKEIKLKSSTDGSTKEFKITVDDTGTLTATEV